MRQFSLADKADQGKLGATEAWAGIAMIVFINVFTVEAANQQRLIELLSRVTDTYVRHAPGFLRSTLHRSFDGTKVTMHAQWASIEDYEAMRRDPRPASILREALTISAFEPGMYEEVRTFIPD